MFDKLKNINWNKANLQDGKTYRKITTHERIIHVHEDQQYTYFKYYAVFLIIGLIFIIMESPKIHFEVPNYALWYNWLILIIGVELTMIVAATGILIVVWFLTPKQIKNLKWFTIKKGSHKTTFTFELLENE